MTALILSQTSLAEAETLWTSPRFFVAVFAGFVIAIAFQLVMTNLSVALGATALSGLDENDDEDGSASRHGGQGTRSTFGESFRKANHAFGAWALLSASVALFFAAWLGTELSMTVDRTSGAVTGLAIWGLFYFTMMFVEKSVVGAVLRTATSGVSSVARGVGGVFTKSERKKAGQTASEIASAVRDELLEDQRLRSVGRQIRETVHRLEDNLDPVARRKQMAKLLSRTEIEASVGDGRHASDGATGISASIKTRPGPSTSTLNRARNEVSRARAIIDEEARSPKRPVDTAADATMRVAGLSTKKAEAYRSRFEEFLRETELEELEPESLKADLELLFDEPSLGWEALKERFSRKHQDAFHAVLTARGMDDERARRIIERAETVMRQLSHPGDTARDIGHRADERARGVLADIDDPRLRYQDLRDEIELLLDDPKAGYDALLTRLESLDRDTLISILTLRESVDEESANSTLAAIEDARDSVIERAERARSEVVRRVDVAKQSSLELAEETRKVVATAAWWAFGAAAVSGAAAAAGGIVAVTTGVG